MKKYYSAHKNYLLGLSKNPRAIKFVPWTSPSNLEEILKIFLWV